MQSLSSLNDEANLSVAAHIDSIPREGVRSARQGAHMDEAYWLFLGGVCVGFLFGFAVCAVISRLYHRAHGF
jgi:hypothetical protein